MSAARAAGTRTARHDDALAAQAELACQRDWLARFFARHVRRREDAEDLTQEVLARAAGSLDRFRGDCPFSQWVLAIARRALVNYYQRDPYRKGRYVPWPDQEPDTSYDPQRSADTMGPSSMTEGRDVAQRLLAHMASVCSEDERRVIVMVYQGEALEEAAVVLGKSASTVRSLYRRGRQKLIAHVVLHDVDLLGGREGIERAWAAAETAPDAGDRPTPQEAQAWREPAGRLEAYRGACLKMAKYLSLAAALGGWLYDAGRWTGL